MRHWLKFAAIILASSAASTSPGTAQDIERGQYFFGKYCASCHGDDAKGHGSIATLFDETPMNLTQLSAENGGVFPVIRTAHRIDGREEVTAHGGPMPFYGDILGRPTVMIETEDGTPLEVGRTIADLVAYLQSIQAD